MAGRCGVCRSPARVHAVARPCRAVAPCAACPAPRAGGESGVRTGALVRAQYGRARLACHWGGLVRRPRRVCRVVARSGGGLTGGGWRPPVRCPDDGLPLPAARRWGLVRAVGPHPAWRVGAGARRGCPSCVRSRGPVQRSPAGVSHVRRGRGARAARRCGDGTASSRCGGVGGTAPTVSRLRQRVARVRRGRAVRVPRVARRRGRPRASGDRAGRASGAQRGRTSACKRRRGARLVVGRRGAVLLPGAPEAWR